MKKIILILTMIFVLTVPAFASTFRLPLFPSGTTITGTLSSATSSVTYIQDASNVEFVVTVGQPVGSASSLALTINGTTDGSIFYTIPWIATTREFPVTYTTTKALNVGTYYALIPTGIAPAIQVKLTGTISGTDFYSVTGTLLGIK